MRSVRREAEAVGGQKVLRIDLTGVSVFIAMPTHRDLPPQTVISLLKTQRVLDKNNIPCEVLIEPGVSLVEVARSMCVYRFLQTEATRMFWVDSDITWEPDAFIRMLALSAKVDVVCGAYPAKEEPLRFHLGTPGRVTMNEYGCIPCRGGGLGFTIVNRRVIEAMAEQSPIIRYPRATFPDSTVAIRHLFHSGDSDGDWVTEDVMFFRDVEALGYQSWCDPVLTLGHVGSKTYEGSFYDYTMSKQAAE
jgi:hypothetical protein